MKPDFLKPLFLLTASMIPGATSLAAELPSIEPERVGVSSERLAAVNELARKYVDNGQFAGMVTMVSRHGKVIHLNAEGRYGLDNNTPIAADTLFRIFSMTKPVTAVAALMLYEEGKFQMTDPVSEHLPEFSDQQLQRGDELVPPASPMTMRQLFTHTAGLTYGYTLDNAVDHSNRVPVITTALHPISSGPSWNGSADNHSTSFSRKGSSSRWVCKTRSSRFRRKKCTGWPAPIPGTVTITRLH
jgi:CubicO group peptidase (beta-lactamase class C family)